MKIGVILFDNFNDGEEGWAAKSGHEAERINGIHSLEQKVIWVTNLKFKEFQELGFNRISNLRESHYMRIELNSLIKELDLEKSPSKAAQYIANIFQRIIDFGEDMFEIDAEEPAYRYANLLASKIIPMHMKKPPTHNKESITDALEEATQYMQSSYGKRPKGRTLITLSMPRIGYNNWLFSRQVPVEREWKNVAFNSGSFEVGVEKGKTIEGTTTRMGKLKKLAENSAFLLNISIKHIEDEYSQFSSFGVGKPKPRSWVTFPELTEIIRYSKVEVVKAIKTDIGDIDESVKDKDPSTNFSFSKGLFLENLGSSISTPVDSVYNGVIPYLRAYDRSACLRAAEVLKQEGYYIMSYGVGRVTILVPETGVKELIGQALSMGLMPPLNLLNTIKSGEVELEKDMVTEWMPEGLKEYIENDWFIELIRALAPAGLIDTDLIIRIDDVIDLPREERQHKLDEIINELVNASENIDEEDSESGSSSDLDDTEEVIDL